MADWKRTRHQCKDNDYDVDEVDDDLKDGGWLKGLSDGKGWLGGRLKPSSKAARFSCLINLVVDDDIDDDKDDRDGDDDEDGDFHHLRLAPALGPVE